MQAGLLRQVRPRSRAPVAAPDLDLCSACACTPHNIIISVLSIGQEYMRSTPSLSRPQLQVEHAGVQGDHMSKW